MELPFDIKKAVRHYKPITKDGHTLYPVLVGEYDEFLMAQPALEVMQQSFPVALMRVPLLEACYRMDYEAAVSGQTPTGLFSRSLLALALSLRLGEGLDPAKRAGLFQVAVDRDRPEKLQWLRYDAGGGETKDITPAQYQMLRPIIAAQNGVKIEDDTANPDIVAARQKMASSAEMRIIPDADDLLNAIAALSGEDEADIEGWPILKLHKRTEAYQRILDYVICGVNEGQGVTWKGGNPAPSPFFRRTASADGFASVMDNSAATQNAPPPEASIINQHLKE